MHSIMKMGPNDSYIYLMYDFIAPVILKSSNDYDTKKCVSEGMTCVFVFWSQCLNKHCRDTTALSGETGRRI